MLYNYNFGQLNNQSLIYAPKNLEFNDDLYIPASDEILIEAGYYPIVDTPYPDDGNYYIGSWVIQNNQIIKVWTQTEPPEPPEPVDDPLLDLEEMTIDHEYRLTLLELGVE